MTAHEIRQPAQGESLSPDQVRERLRRKSVTPFALRVPCVEHGAEPGEYCFGSLGVCGARVSRGGAAHRSTKSRPTNPKE